MAQRKHTMSSREIEPSAISGKAMLTVTRPDGTKHEVEIGPPVSVRMEGDIFIFDYGYVVEVGEEVILRFSIFKMFGK
jgi:hypothetical protein